MRSIAIDDAGNYVAPGGGGLTNTQLRASAVPVSGPLTNTELRAVAVPGSVADGADIALGTRADAAWTAGNGTVIGLLKGIYSRFATVLSVTPTKLGTTSRQPVWASGQHVVTSATSAKTTAITGTEVLITASADCYINIGTQSSVVATKGAGSMFIAKGGPYLFQITSGQGVAAIQDVAAGTVSVIPVA